MGVEGGAGVTTCSNLLILYATYIVLFKGAWSTHTKPSHTRVNSPHFWSTHPIYEIKKDYSEGGLMVFSTYCVTGHWVFSTYFGTTISTPIS